MGQLKKLMAQAVKHMDTDASVFSTLPRHPEASPRALAARLGKTGGEVTASLGYDNDSFIFTPQGPDSVSLDKVAVDGAEVGDVHPPDTLTRRVEESELLPLGVADAQGRELGAVGRLTRTVYVKCSQAPFDGEYSDDPAVLLWHPAATIAVIAPDRNVDPDGHVQEVLDIMDDRLAELDRDRTLSIGLGEH